MHLRGPRPHDGPARVPPIAGLEEVGRRRRGLVKRYHPDRFADPEQRERAERLTAEINAAHDVVERYLLRS